MSVRHFGPRLGKVCSEFMASGIKSNTIVCGRDVCLHSCVRDLGRVTVNTRLVNSHQHEQTGWCLFAFLHRLLFCVCTSVVHLSVYVCVCVKCIVSLALQLFTSSNWPRSIAVSSSQWKCCLSSLICIKIVRKSIQLPVFPGYGTYCTGLTYSIVQT